MAFFPKEPSCIPLAAHILVEHDQHTTNTCQLVLRFRSESLFMPGTSYAMCNASLSSASRYSPHCQSPLQWYSRCHCFSHLHALLQLRGQLCRLFQVWHIRSCILTAIYRSVSPMYCLEQSLNGTSLMTPSRSSRITSLVPLHNCHCHGCA